MNTPKIRENLTIHFEVVNQLNKVELTREMEYLMPYLKNKLNNHQIKYDITISKTVRIETAYSQKEKYDLLIKINPELEKLRQSFNLEF